jgi:hypothetical protein
MAARSLCGWRLGGSEKEDEDHRCNAHCVSLLKMNFRSHRYGRHHVLDAWRLAATMERNMRNGEKATPTAGSIKQH